jgi:hypothetical protein
MARQFSLKHGSVSDSTPPNDAADVKLLVHYGIAISPRLYGLQKCYANSAFRTPGDPAGTERAGRIKGQFKLVGDVSGICDFDAGACDAQIAHHTVD